MENVSDKSKPSMSVIEKIGTVVFFISFLPLIYAVFKGFSGAFLGLQGFAWFFGLPAIISTLIYECFLFFMPIGCLIYQIIFGRDFIRHHDTLKRLTKILVGFLIAASVISTVFAGQLLNIKHTVYQPLIRNHLKAQFGEKAATEISYEIASKQELSYTAHSPILPQDQSFEIRIINQGEIWDDLTSAFFEANKDFCRDLKNYIIKKENIPEDFDYDLSIVSIDFQDYRDGEDYTVLFDRTKYVFTGVTVNYTQVTEAVITDVTDKVWKEVYSKVPLNKIFAITFKEKDSTACRVEISGNPKSNKATANVYVWSESSPVFGLHKKKIELNR